MGKRANIVYRIMVIYSILLALGTAGTSDAIGMSEKEILTRMMASVAVFVAATLFRKGCFVADRIRVQRKVEQDRYLRIKEITEKMQKEREEIEENIFSLRENK